MSSKTLETSRVEPGSGATISPVLPLVLLESLRGHDLPDEVLEDENLESSLPRRLGLTGVIESRIKDYQLAARRGAGVSLAHFADLVRLVLRRPDAEQVFRGAGHRLARRHFRGMPGAVLVALRLLPARAGLAAVRRAARGMLKPAVADATVEIGGVSPIIRMTNAPTARFDETGRACALYTGAFEELIHLYTGNQPLVVHTACAVRGEEACEWQIART